MSNVPGFRSPSALEIGSVDPESPKAQWCLAQYFDELGRRFDDGFDPVKSTVADSGDFAPPNGVFMVGTVEGRPVACGAIKLVSARVAYIKRMWVDGSQRGLGLGRRMLVALEEEATRLGCDTIQLETNRSLLEAIRLYRSAGYEEVEPFNDEHYAHHWFQKRLSPAPSHDP